MSKTSNSRPDTLFALFAIALGVVALIAVVLGRAATVHSRQLEVAAAPSLDIDGDGAVKRLSRALQFQTVSYSELDPPSPVQHEEFLAWMIDAYPRVHAELGREIVGGRSVLYTWSGSDPSLAPVLLMGHYDVVPAEPGTESRWTHPPFSGAIDAQHVWGRGALDDKSSILGILEAIELLLGQQFRPKRTILLAFGHDEELGGLEGAAAISRLLQTRTVKLEAVIDEGGTITSGLIEGLRDPVALIGIAEKGLLSVEITAQGEGGHSSMPPARTQVGLVAEAVDRLQRHQFKAMMRGAGAEMFRWLAPEMPFSRRIIVSNLWLFRPVLEFQARKSESLNAIMRTTTAPTMLSGGVKENVMPTRAHAVVNFRILPGGTVERVLRHVRDQVKHPSITIRVVGRLTADPSAVSDPEAPQFALLARTIRQVFPDVLVAPYLVLGATDSRHFAPLTPNIYRFAPARLARQDLSRIHGLNERVSIDGYLEGIRFYHTLIRNLHDPSLQ